MLEGECKGGVRFRRLSEPTMSGRRGHAAHAYPCGVPGARSDAVTTIELEGTIAHALRRDTGRGSAQGYVRTGPLEGGKLLGRTSACCHQERTNAWHPHCDTEGRARARLRPTAERRACRGERDGGERRRSGGNGLSGPQSGRMDGDGATAKGRFFLARGGRSLCERCELVQECPCTASSRILFGEVLYANIFYRYPCAPCATKTGTATSYKRVSKIRSASPCKGGPCGDAVGHLQLSGKEQKRPPSGLRESNKAVIGEPSYLR